MADVKGGALELVPEIQELWTKSAVAEWPWAPKRPHKRREEGSSPA